VQCVVKPCSPRPLADVDSWLELEGKNPVSVLNELHPEVECGAELAITHPAPQATFQLVEASGPSHSPLFCICATLGQMVQCLHYTSPPARSTSRAARCPSARPSWRPARRC
jgi:hypothetical protein